MKEYLKKSQRFVALVLSVLISFTMMPNVFALNTGVAGDRDPDRETVKAGYTLKGVVKDSAGKVVSGASVKLTLGTKTIKTVKTSTKGAYTITSVAKGTAYVLTTTKAGYEDSKITKLSVTKATTKNVVLKPINITVEVKNEDGKAVKNAEVTLKRGTASLKGTTNAYGKYVFAKATKGDYTGTIKATGYADGSIKKFAVSKSLTKKVELTKKAVEATVTAVAVTTAPTKVTYTAGEKLDLTGMAVTLTMSDGKTEVVPFASFATKGITTDPVNQADLAVTVTKVTVTHTASTKTADQTITVTPAVDADQAAVDAEKAKYEAAVTIANTVAANAAVTDSVIKLKAEQTATAGITVAYAEKTDAGNFLTTVDNTSIVLAKQAANNATDNTAVVTLTFTKNGKTATLDVAVTIEPQVSTAIIATDVSIVSSKVLRVTFSGAVKTALASNFTVNEKVSNAVSAVSGVSISADKLSVDVTLYDALTNAKTYKVMVTGVIDNKDAAVPTYTKEVEFVRGAPASIEFVGTKLPKESVDLAAFVAVKDASGNVLDSGFTVGFETTSSTPITGTLMNLDTTNTATAVSLKATITGTTITTGLKTLAVERRAITTIDEIVLQKDGIDVVALFVGGNALTATNTIVSSATAPVLDVVCLDQFGDEITATVGTNVVFTSNNAVTATVTVDGVITPISVGNVAITAKAGTVTKTVSYEVKARPSAETLEVDAAVSLVGSNSAPRMPIKIVAKDQYGIKADVTNLKFVNSASDIAGLCLTEASGTPISSGSNITVTNGEQVYYVQGLKNGAATFTFELTVGTQKVTQTTTVTASAAGSFAGYSIELVKDSINVNTTGDYAQVKVYKVDGSGARIADVTSTVTFDPATGNTLIQPITGQNGYFEKNVNNATTTGSVVVTIKDSTYEVGTVTIKTVKSLSTITSVALESSRIKLDKSTTLLGFGLDNIVNNLIITMSDGTVYGKDSTGAKLAAKKELLGDVISSNSAIVLINKSIETALPTDPKTWGAMAAPNLAGTDIEGIEKAPVITKGITSITVKFADDQFAAKAFEVEVGDISIDSDLTIDGNVTTGYTTTKVTTLTVASGATLIIPSGKKLIYDTTNAAPTVTLNGTIQNNSEIVAVVGSVLAASETGKGILSGIGKITSGEASSTLAITGNLEISAGSTQTIQPTSTNALTVTLAKPAGAGSVFTNNGTLVIAGNDDAVAIATFINGASTSANVINNYGKITLRGGLNQTASNAVFTNGVTSNVDTIKNYGTIEVLGSASLTNASTAALSNVDEFGAILNKGTIKVAAGSYTGSTATLALQDDAPTPNAFVNDGTVEIINGGSATTPIVATLSIAATGVISNNGTINNNGVIALTTSGTIACLTTPGTATTSTLNGKGSITGSTAALVVTGKLNIPSTADLTIGSSVEFAVGDGTTFSTVTNAGKINTEATAVTQLAKKGEILIDELGSLINTGTITLNDAGEITIGNGTDPSTLRNDGTITLVTAGVITVEDPSTLTNNGLIDIKGTSTLDVKGDGTVAASGMLEVGANGEVRSIADTSVLLTGVLKFTGASASTKGLRLAVGTIVVDDTSDVVVTAKTSPDAAGMNFAVGDATTTVANASATGIVIQGATTASASGNVLKLPVDDMCKFAVDGSAATVYVFTKVVAA